MIRALKQIISWREKPQVIRCENGPENISATIQNWAKDWDYGLNTFSRESHSRMLMLNGSTGQFATNGYPSTTGQALKKFRTSPRNGCGPTITTARIWPWAVSPQSSVWPWLHNRSTFRSRGNRGDYHYPTTTEKSYVYMSKLTRRWAARGTSPRHLQAGSTALTRTSTDF